MFSPRCTYSAMATACIWLSKALRTGGDVTSRPLTYSCHSAPAKPSTIRSSFCGLSSTRKLRRNQTGSGYGCVGSAGSWYDQAPMRIGSQPSVTAAGAA